MDLSEAIDAFIDHCQSIRQLSPHTMRAYRLDLQGFVQFAGADPTLATCDRAFVQGYVKHLFEVRFLKEATVKRHLATLRAFFRWLADDRDGFVDPILGVRFRIRLPKRLPRVIPRNDLRTLLRQDAGCDSSSFGTLTARVSVELLFATGMRVGELAGLLDSAVDLEEGIITIIGKGNRQRRVFILQEITELLRDYQRVRDSARPKADTFLTNTRGTAASAPCIRRLIRIHAERAAVPQRITPHMFRHSAATYLLEEGVDIRYVQRLLGHRSISTTEIYTHVADSALRTRIVGMSMAVENGASMAAKKGPAPDRRL